ncbi:MAG: DEAD/DEAH box helicase, partial [Alphaproteobacteria bacterium]
HKHGYIELPTGVGKTALFISLIKNYLEAANGDENAPRVLIAVPTEKLAVQTAQSFAKFMPEIAKTIETDGDEGKEIDWENSDIGLQYGKKKHAHKKPKVLITTYQSLARDTADKTYPPSEYGYVIYDEGHVITAPTFGKAVDKFRDSVQLAVSATPEYTQTKTVASRLPHRYFQLPLAEAINRGDLCNVRPAILKTGYRIDESLFQKFMEQQGGTPLNEAQLQQLLNQEARNKAVIETYLRGADPDSGERYFGQNGMIFCTGVKHADSIAEQFKKTMEKPGDGQALKRWLDNEQIELIAPVHGQAKGAWLKKGLLPNKANDLRKFQGEKEWYTEEEIFDLHERGKILLLASVAKLKWGFDSPRDSLLFELADRFSKVDATQIDGRAFRIDPDNPEKTATVFNLMDENTEELYAKYPKMIPIYCAEVIEGADFRPPARRPHAHVRFKEPPPGMEKSLHEAGFDVLTNINAVRTISRNNKAKREEARKKLPSVEEGWLSVTQAADLYIGNSSNFSKVIKEYRLSKKQQLLTEGKTIEEAEAIINQQ